MHLSVSIYLSGIVKQSSLTSKEQEIKTIQLEEVLNERADEEMEVSDAEDEYHSGGPAKKRSRAETEDKVNLASVKEENDSLRCQLEAYKNEVDLVRVDSTTEIEQKDKQIKMLQQTLQGMQQQLVESQRRQTDDDVRVRTLEARLRTAGDVQAAVEAARAAAAAAAAAAGSPRAEEGEAKADEEVAAVEEEAKVDVLEVARLVVPISSINDKEARLIGLISTFLHVHPFGASVDYVWSYLQKMEPLLRPSEIEALMSRFPLVFHERLSGIGANMERRWHFAGFDAPRGV